MQISKAATARNGVAWHLLPQSQRHQLRELENRRVGADNTFA